ncbi:hypothetical protein FCM35_KLT22226 [Carex littledalei]|uniref:Uncharacterized protein n=1 Tax=Carex littledalei TaxID=544730 RepID=A0A833Q6Q6_9POAL|nr:hypothetical protein FCM35_KLT22226 [Carex littledalei]
MPRAKRGETRWSGASKRGDAPRKIGLSGASKRGTPRRNKSECWRNPCVGAWSNALLLSLGFLPALTDAVPSAIALRGICPADFGRSLVRIIALIRRLSCCRWRHADRVLSRSC